MLPRFSDFLVSEAYLGVSAWSRVSDVLAEARQGFLATLIGLGLISEQKLSEALSSFYKFPLAEENDWPVAVLELDSITPPPFSHENSAKHWLVGDKRLIKAQAQHRAASHTPRKPSTNIRLRGLLPQRMTMQATSPLMAPTPAMTR